MRFLIGIILVSIFSTSTFAQERSGCVVFDGKKLIQDTACLCAEKNQCAKFPKIKYDSDFFDSKDSKGKNLFSEKLKNSYKSSYDQYNKIIEMKSQGKGNSEEIKAYYQKLDKLNSEVRTELGKTQPVFMAKKKTEFAAFLQKQKIADKKVEDSLKDFVFGGGAPPVNSFKPVGSSKKSSSIVHKSVVKNGDNTGIYLGTKEKMAVKEKTTEDNSVILRNINNPKYKVDEEDSIFDVITKTYIRRAYKDLLAP